MTPEQIIIQLEQHSGRLDKERILATQVDQNNIEFFDGVRMALDNLVTFGVKKVPLHGGPDGQGLPWKPFLELAQSLYARDLTGHAARDAIELAMSVSTQEQWNNWYRRILIKDLRCGVSEKTVNKVLKNNTHGIRSIPVFECMLAHDSANHEKKLVGRKLLEPKLDGVRVLTVVNIDNRTAIQYTRNGKVLENFSHITKSIEDNIDLIGRSLVLDGEMISSSFQDLMKQVHRKENVKTDDAVLMLFDIVPLSEFRNGESVLGQRRRSALLKSMKPIFDKIGNIDVIPYVEVNLDEFVGEVQLKEFGEQAVHDGFEGIMIKDVDATYECKRSAHWLKQKPFIEVSLPIVNIEEGTGKNQGKLGALICEGQDDGKRIHVNVGSGFTDSQRDEIWKDKDYIIGQVIEIRADVITKNQDSDDIYSLRFPRFLRFRGFKVGEKI